MYEHLLPGLFTFNLVIKQTINKRERKHKIKETQVVMVDNVNNGVIPIAPISLVVINDRDK